MLTPFSELDHFCNKKRKSEAILDKKSSSRRIYFHDYLFPWSFRHMKIHNNQNCDFVAYRASKAKVSRSLRVMMQHCKDVLIDKATIELKQKRLSLRCSSTIFSIIARCCKVLSNNSETIYVGISLYLKYLEKRYIPSTNDCHVLGIALGLVAVKLMEDGDVYLSKVLHELQLSQDFKRKILAAERKAMRVLNWNLYIPTPEIIGCILFGSYEASLLIYSPFNSFLKHCELQLRIFLENEQDFVRFIPFNPFELVLAIMSFIVKKNTEFSFLKCLIKRFEAIEKRLRGN